MSEAVHTLDDLDAYRDRVETILVGSQSAITDPIHIQSSERWMEPLCTTGGDWIDKPTSIFPHRPLCPHCAEQHFDIEVIDDE